MKQIPLAILLIATCTFFLACKGRVYTIPSGAMAETLPAGPHVYITNSKVFKNNDIAVFNYFGDDYGKPVEDD